jgi:hypothetical protein
MRGDQRNGVNPVPQRLRLWFLVVLIAVPACTRRGQSPEDLPTPAEFNAVATAAFQTQNAPPPGFGEVSFPQVDARLNDLAGWRYVVQLEFDGTFARTTRETSANASAEVWYNQLASSRRVSVQTRGELVGDDDTTYEAVRLGPDAFLVRNEICLANAGTDAETAADLSAGNLVGGVIRGTPTGLHATLNGVESWQYTFTYEDLNLPNIILEGDGRVFFTSGELWVAPEHNVVTRFYVNIELENARIFDRQLPVTGTVIIRYDLYDIGVQPNITVPFGC